MQYPLFFMSDENKTEFKNTDGRDQKIKNLISLVILLTGLFVGSLFVDLSQLANGGGVSQKMLDGKDIFQLNNKTWVAYSDPIVNVDIINDDACDDCNIDEALVWFKKILPTMLANKVDYSSDKGKSLIKKFNIKSLPAFIFAGDIKDTEFYSQAEQLLSEKESKYVLDTAKLGLPAGKYIKLPKISDTDIKIGPDHAKVKLVEFSDFQCPYCKMFQGTIDDILKEYGDDVQLIFKNLPLNSIHPRARAAALAGECANEQKAFMDYSKQLFDNQEKWSKTKNNDLFISYARKVKIDSRKFKQCLDDNKYKDIIDGTIAEAEDFGISGTPAIFINDNFKGGVVKADELRSLIDEELGKVKDTATDSSKTVTEETK